MDMERFSHLLDILSLFLFLNFTPLYIFLIYGVFLIKDLQTFSLKKLIMNRQFYVGSFRKLFGLLNLFWKH
jgi:hypothetical protein